MFNNEKQQFCTLCTSVFHFCTICIRFRPLHDVKWRDLSNKHDFYYFLGISKPPENSYFNNTEAEMSLILKNMLRNVPEAEIFSEFLYRMLKICKMQ